jgi:hypothetical protein
MNTASYLLAAKNGDWESMVKFLNINENIKFSVDVKTKKTAAVLVIENNHIEVLRSMLQRGAAVSYEPASHRDSPLLDQIDSTLLLGQLAASLGNIDAIEALGAVDNEIYATWSYDNILNVAARNNQRDLIEWLIDFAHMNIGYNLLSIAVDSGHLSLAKWMRSTGRAGVSDIEAVMLVARDKNWKLLSILLDICDPDFNSVDNKGNTFWDIVDWRDLVTVYKDSVDVITFMATLREKVIFPENVTRLMRNANIYTSESYLRAARDGNWSHMSTCLDEYFPLFKSEDVDGKSAAMLVIDSETHVNILSSLDKRRALYYPSCGFSRTYTMKKLCMYAADTMKVASIRELFGVGGDIFAEGLVLDFANIGGLEIMYWFMENYQKTVLHGVTKFGENVLALAILGDQLDIVEWLMDTYQMTTFEESPLHYGVNNGDPTFSTARWLLETGRASQSDLQTEFAKVIKSNEWLTATKFIEILKVNIDEDSLWRTVDWTKFVYNNSKEKKLFLRALLPRVDFPSHVSKILMETSSRPDDGEEIYFYRQLIIDGMRVREKVKTLYKSRTRYVKDLKLPEAVKKFNILNSFLSDNQMDLSTETMWESIRE